MIPVGQAVPAARRASALVPLGIAVGLLGIVAAAVLWMAALRRDDDAVRGLARAPAGCTTTLEFDQAGRFYVFVETQGRIGDLGGSCANDNREYDLAESPVVELVLSGPEGEVTLADVSGPRYDSAGFVGVAERAFAVSAPGTYSLDVRANDEAAVVAVGRDVTEAGGALRMVSIGAGGVGAALGLLLVLLGLSRRPARGSSMPAPGGSVMPAPGGSWAPPAGPRYG